VVPNFSSPTVGQHWGWRASFALSFLVSLVVNFGESRLSFSQCAQADQVSDLGATGSTVR
jgi:predicted MFS family arabinose efflux permease